jgi:hypothetical protein
VQQTITTNKTSIPVNTIVSESQQVKGEISLLLHNQVHAYDHYSLAKWSRRARAAFTINVRAHDSALSQDLIPVALDSCPVRSTSKFSVGV